MAQVETSASASAPAADELLSKLAGDEIDRLLAEAEKESIPPDVAKALDDAEATVAAQAPRSAASVPIVAPSPGKVPSDGISTPATNVDELLKETAAAPARAGAKTLAAISSDVVAATEAISKIVTAPAITISAVTPRVAAAASSEITGAPNADDPASGNDAIREREPIFIRILELINAPLNQTNDAARQLVGWVGILTLFNSIVILGYIHFLRHK